ncbi:hypothetical protein H4582DRAFT_2058193 [Lactarius indigo]|nr:hypothetical protein H4582DRAFT_2058193 [Lactarius indigo]
MTASAHGSTPWLRLRWRNDVPPSNDFGKVPYQRVPGVPARLWQERSGARGTCASASVFTREIVTARSKVRGQGETREAILFGWYIDSPPWVERIRNSRLGSAKGVVVVMRGCSAFTEVVKQGGGRGTREELATGGSRTGRFVIVRYLRGVHQDAM